MKTHFFDIESLDSVFTMAIFKPEIPAIDLYMIDDLELIFEKDNPNPKDPTLLPSLKDYVKSKNRGIYDVDTAEFTLHNILSSEGWEHYAKTFGCYYQSTQYKDKLAEVSEDYKLIADTDDGYDSDIHPYLLGYNSYNYDTTMMALAGERLLIRELDRRSGGTPAPLTAKSLRALNDDLFNPAIKKSMPSYLMLKPVSLKQKSLANRRANQYANPLYAQYATKQSSYGIDFERDFTSRQNLIRKHMLLTGRYIDVARLNEKQQHVQLKRLLGMLGHQILESDRLDTQNSHISNLEDLFDLIAYNASDVINLYHLFNHPVYKSQFELKRAMLETYPELVYEASVQTVTDKDGNEHPTLKVDKTRVRSNRLYADSSSQQLTSRALCPVGHLYDNRTVSFMYPSEEKAKEIGLDGPYNVLESCKQFFKNEVLSRIENPEEKAQVKALVDEVFSFYDDVQGENFNTSTKNTDMMYYDGELRSTAEEGRDYGRYSSLSDLPSRPNCIPYYGPNGRPTSCFVTFSTGGIHGAEYNWRLYSADLIQYETFRANMEYAQSLCGNDPVVLRNMVNPSTAPIPGEFPDGEPHYLKEFLKSGFTKTKATWKPLNPPELFQAKQGSKNTKLNKRYVYTSASLVNHEDFSSYYPNLLRSMGAFNNEALGTDRYGEIYMEKEEYGVLMKDRSLSAADRLMYALLRNGKKLILNTASGAGDATFDNPVRMNNKIIAMRIIGQLFSWRIGQAQALQGARVPSTNTDGLYTILDAELNEEILQKEAEKISVEIESEPMLLISKDSNNRIEYEHDPDVPGAFKILAAGGGSLACYNGPDPSKSLNHPAIMDHVLAQYLMGIVDYAGEDGLLLPYKPSIGMNIIEQYVAQHTTSRKGKIKLLTMFQNVIAASTSSIAYHFATPTGSHILDDSARQLADSYALPHINRIFIFDEDKEGTHDLRTVHIRAASAQIITEAVARNRTKNNLRAVQDSPLSLKILAANGEDINQVRNAGKGKQREAVVNKINGIDPDWHMYICNDSLHELDDATIDAIIENLDLTSYNKLIESTYNKNWQNALPQDLWPEKIQEIYHTWFGDTTCEMVISDDETKDE